MRATDNFGPPLRVGPSGRSSLQLHTHIAFHTRSGHEAGCQKTPCGSLGTERWNPPPCGSRWVQAANPGRCPDSCGMSSHIPPLQGRTFISSGQVESGVFRLKSHLLSLCPEMCWVPGRPCPPSALVSCYSWEP